MHRSSNTSIRTLVLALILCTVTVYAGNKRMIPLPIKRHYATVGLEYTDHTVDSFDHFFKEYEIVRSVPEFWDTTFYLHRFMREFGAKDSDFGIHFFRA
jgi:hypothetical protein